MSNGESSKVVEDPMQQALLESIRQNGRLLDELQAARRREDQLLDRLFYLEEEMHRHPCFDTKSSTSQPTTVIELKEEEQECAIDEEQNNEELVEWRRAPHYEIKVNGQATCEGFVANNSAVSFIRPEAVKRAKLKPYKVNPPARFKFLGCDELVVVDEAVMVPMQIGEYQGKYPMFIYTVRSEIILGANWLHNERVNWGYNFLMIGPKKINVHPKPPVMVKKSDPRADMMDGPVIIERIN